MDQKKVGAFLAQLRHEQGLTQEALGRELGVTNKTVSRWENGNYLPDVELLLLLSRRYGVTVNELLTGERLEDGAYRQAAEENLVTALKSDVFTSKERMAFWKKKWKREHVFEMVLSTAAVAALYAWGLFRGAGEFCALSALAAIVLYCKLRNDMMAYAEGRSYLSETACEKEAAPGRRP